MSARMVSAEEARGLVRDHEAYRQRASLSAMRTDLEAVAPDLAYTVVQQAEQIDGLKYLIAAIAQDWGSKCCDDPDNCACTMGQAIRLARSLGVTS